MGPHIGMNGPEEEVIQLLELLHPCEKAGRRAPHPASDSGALGRDTPPLDGLVFASLFTEQPSKRSDLERQGKKI